MQTKLGEFIRVHRERITPAEVGLPGGGRRRTAGLRREELAQLCGVSPTWLTWLEQGRPVSASGKLLGTLADVMRLTAAERQYLFSLADKLDPQGGQETSAPTGHLQAMVDAIVTPAYILNRSWDAVACNVAARALLPGWLDQHASPADSGADGDGDSVAPAAPNLLRFMFLAAPARALVADWPDRAARLVAEFRADCGKYADQPPQAMLITELAAASDTFRQLWNAQAVVGREGGSRRFLHPSRGELNFEQVTLHLATRRELKLVMLLPA